MSEYSELDEQARQWLAENEQPGVRYLAQRDLLDYAQDTPELLAARREAHRSGPIAAILAEMQPDGYWVAPGSGYNPKYRSTVWATILLAELGADVAEDERIGRACTYLLEQALTHNGQFSVNGAPSGTIDCLQGNLCWALTALGCQDARLDAAFDWMARTVTGEGIAPQEDKQAPLRFYAYKSGPAFACGVNSQLPCAWGAAKVMLAFSLLPPEKRTPLIQRAIAQGLGFLFSVDPATAAYPSGTTGIPSQSWWKFGFPIFYVTDILQMAEVLAAFGFGKDPRLANTAALIRSKQDRQGRWPLEYDYAGKTWVDFGLKKQPNPWVTLRALRALK